MLLLGYSQANEPHKALSEIVEDIQHYFWIEKQVVSSFSALKSTLMFYLGFLCKTKSVSVEFAASKLWFSQVLRGLFVQLVTGNYWIQPTLSSVKWLCELFSFLICWYINPTFFIFNSGMQIYMKKKLQLDECAGSNAYILKNIYK